MCGRRLLVGLVAGLVLVAIVAGGALAAAGTYAYRQTLSVASACGGRYADHDPAHFDPEGISSEFTSTLDLEPYAMTGFEDVTFASRDSRGYALHAWWIPGPGADAPAVILVHGMGACRRDPVILLPAGMLHRNGFSVLLVDLRDHGDSTVEDGLYAGGTEEYLDVLGAWDWLVEERGIAPAKVGVYGESMGAPVAITATAEEPRVAALWAGSSYADFRSMGNEELDRQGIPRFLLDAAIFMGPIVSDDHVTAMSPDTEIAKLASRPLALVAGEKDKRVQIHHVHDLAAAAAAGGTPVEPWIVPGAHHSEAAFLVPGEYERRLVTFFRGALGSPAGAAAGPSAP